MSSPMQQTSNEIVSALTMHEGDGAEVQRLFPIPAGRMNFDPFVLWDHFKIEPGNGFPTHPHRGFEAITYMFEGSMQHKDNLGNNSTVTAGGAQRFTAGRGLEHSEMPATHGASSGIQLWINLPQRLKKMAPEYQQADQASIPLQQRGEVSVRTIVGEGGPVKLHTPVNYLDVSVTKGGEYNQAFPLGYRGIIYVVTGTLQTDTGLIKAGQAYLFENRQQLVLSALIDSRFMLALGKPHGEPIKQYGPYVD